MDCSVASFGFAWEVEKSETPDKCREQGWLLKKWVFLKKVKNRVIENV